MEKWIYMSAVVVFGVIPASDLSLTGIVKDVTVLFGPEGVIFPPGLI